MTRDCLRFTIFVPNVADVQIHTAVDSAHMHLVGFPQDFFLQYLSLRLHDPLAFVTFRLLKQIATQQATGVGVTDETLHFTEES
jgi:hypothetical protein